ncbi:MAG: acetolactate synthase, large subunit, biosynthetic type [Spirochaetaceae bacterium 4572_59]|nr:MAG: acetolactate synthase, large subunit, biosynthetic type [Spirochaetaceae bacterium 4572_59]
MKKGRTYGAKALVKTLEKMGVEIIFGYPGGANLPIYEALAFSSIKHVLARHEQGAAHMADGYARATGKVGVCLATSGPGATNLVTGIATAYMDSVPILAITGQVPRSDIGTDAFQEVDISGITIPITKHNILVQDVKEIPARIEEAIHICSTGRKGPVLVDIPKDVLQEEFTLLPAKEILLEGYNPNSVGHPGQIKRVAKIIDQARRPLIIAGGGIVSTDAFKELKNFAEKTSIPLTYTFMGKTAMDNDHPLNFGMCGYHGKLVANRAIDQSDVIIALGARFSNRHTISSKTYPGHRKLIHIDIDPAEIGKNIETLLPIVGDIRQILEKLLGIVNPGNHQEWLNTLRSIDEKSHEPVIPDTVLTEVVVMRLMQEYIKDSIVTTDVGRHQMFAAHEINSKSGRGFISSGGLGTMGFGLPSAIGAAIGLPDTEMGLNIIVLLMNDSKLGMITQLQDEFYKSGFDISPLSAHIDFVKLTESMGGSGHSVSTQKELRKLLADDSLQKGFHVIDCVIGKDEHAFPMVNGSSIVDVVEKRGK